MNFCKDCEYFYHHYKDDSDRCHHPDYNNCSVDLVTGEDDTEYKSCVFIRYKYYGSIQEECPNFKSK